MLLVPLSVFMLALLQAPPQASELPSLPPALVDSPFQMDSVEQSQCAQHEASQVSGAMASVEDVRAPGAAQQLASAGQQDRATCGGLKQVGGGGVGGLLPLHYLCKPLCAAAALMLLPGATTPAAVCCDGLRHHLVPAGRHRQHSSPIVSSV